jgi:ElaA protein
MQWFIKTFEQLTTNELYDILKIRCDVFVVEQACFYPDLDDKDRIEGALHLFAYDGQKLACYLRALPPGGSYDNMSSLGRVATAENYRGTGLGHELLVQGVNLVDQTWPLFTCHISAQAHLQAYYNKQQFHTVGEGYLEDDIPHIGMERAAKVNR